MDKQPQCRASSDDLNCYEFTGGFSCELTDGHEGEHISHPVETPQGPLWRVQWRQLRRWDDNVKAWVEI